MVKGGIGSQSERLFNRDCDIVGENQNRFLFLAFCNENRFVNRGILPFWPLL